MMDMGYWARSMESQQADKLLEFAYEDFHFYVKSEFGGRQVAHMKAFTKQLFYWPRLATFPFGRCKGSDTMW